MAWLETFFLAFLPLFVAVDVLGVLPLFVGLTEQFDEAGRRRLTGQATVTAFSISLVFLIAGKILFGFLGITENDFKVGGGIVLLVLAVNDLLFPHEEKRTPGSMPGVVPIGIPLIMGPAALTTIIVLVQTYGYLWTICSLLANMLVVWVVFIQSSRITRAVGKPGSRAIAKVAALFLAGYAVMMVRSGIQAMVQGMKTP